MSVHPNDDIVIKSGQLAPDFSLQNIDGEMMVLSAQTAVTPLILIFYRGDW
ncbi:MAG: redoxin domain-containing protein [Chloroflexi bacterium]|nr:redoxin domain-containing protein [Chloroflexota bacterium]